jgi:hypothetical protein
MLAAIAGPRTDSETSDPSKWSRHFCLRDGQPDKEGAMKSLIRRFKRTVALALSILAAGLVLTGAAAGDTQSDKQLAVQWWQWVLSIPVSVNPLLDATGADCMVGQRGSDWFLVGAFGGSSATRSCSIPQGASLFVPVVNVVSFDTPGACGQGPEPLPLSGYREFNAAFIDGVTVASVVLDGNTVKNLHREQSPVFDVAMPADNLFASICPGGLPAGIYSPAVDDGIYVRLNPLSVGSHTLEIHAENPSQNFVLDITYHLTVVPVVSK